MKKLSILIIVASCATILLSSCSRLENISVSKRHYRSGYTVDLGSHKQDVSAPHNSEKAAPVANPSSSGNVENKTGMAFASTIKATAPIDLANHSEKKKQSHKHASGNLYASARAVSTIKEDTRDVSLYNYVASMPDVNYSGSASSTSDSAPMWVIILFAILIPPLGVALKFGIVDKFWISLLLTLLFWLPGAIYSVIVVTQ